MKTGIELIAEERQEQIEKHGFDVNRDTEYYSQSELVDAAMFALTDNEEKYYPHNWGLWWKNRMHHKSKIDKLKIAGALIAAEIDRLQNDNPRARM